MKILKRAGKTVVKMSFTEWKKIGLAAGWGDGGYGFRGNDRDGGIGLGDDDMGIEDGVYQDDDGSTEIGQVGGSQYAVGDIVDFTFDIAGGEEGEEEEGAGRIVQILTDDTSGEAFYVIRDKAGVKHTVPQSKVM